MRENKKIIGFDRPLRPEWIYNFLKILKPGEKISSYNDDFEKICKQLVGNEGKRKVRTIVCRSFIYSAQEDKKIVEENYFVHLVHKHSIDELRPIFLLKLIMDYDILRFILRIIFLNENMTGFATDLLTKKNIQLYGDRDVVRKSVGSFLRTLLNFGVINKNCDKCYKIDYTNKLNENQTVLFIEMYAFFYLKSMYINIDSIDEVFKKIYKIDNFQKILQKMHGQRWEYVRDQGRNMLLLK